LTADTGTLTGSFGGTQENFGSLRRLASWLSRELQFKVYDDLGAIVLVGGLLASVGWSVQLARWGNAPFMHATMLIGGVAGFLFARWRFHWALGHLASLAGGFAVVFWQVAYQAEGDNVVERARQVWERYFAWLEAARTGGISTDLLPFSVMLLAVAWIVSYFSSWAVFRWRTPWLATLLLGTAILINLSYRIGRYEHTLFVFVGVTMLLFAHLAHVSRTRRWIGAGMQYPPETRRLNVQDGVLLTIAVVAIAAAAPLFEPRSGLMTDTVGVVMRAPTKRLEEPTKRLLSGVKGRPRVLLQDFGGSLPFLGTFKLADTPVMYIETAYPTLNPGHIYEVYTSAGWVNGPTVEVNVEIGQEIPPAESVAEQLLVTQTVSPDFNTVTAVPAAGAFSSNQLLRVDVLAPLEWVVGPTTTVDDLGPGAPQDVKDFVQSLQTRPVEARRRGTSVEQDLLGRLPDGLAMFGLKLQGGRFVSARLGRSEPVVIDPVSTDLPDGVFAGGEYTISKMISRATDTQLAEAGTDYPDWVTDRYLQLPDTLPARVRELGDLIVEGAGAETPWEKTVAIASYLRSLSYSQQIRGPEAGEDGVDYFLFGTASEPCPPGEGLATNCQDDEAKAYSQYFGSAMAVLLRTQDVPARMVAGYALGQWLPDEGRFVVRDADRHGWAQTYFPGYGWIDVEATPGFPVIARGTTIDEFNRNSSVPPIAISEFEQGFEEDVSEFEALARALRDQELQLVIESRPDPRIYWTAGVGGFVAASAIAGAVAWNFGMSGMAPPQRAYVKLSRLGRFAGISRQLSQTSTEYGHRIDFLVPRTGGAAEQVARRYNAYTYGRRASAEAAANDADALWRKVRGPLLRRAVRRLLPIS
jgi:transglutaminase-like putative cysteine protease